MTPRRIALAFLFGPVLAAGCADQPAKNTLADLRKVQPDVQEVQVEEGLDKAMASYRRFLEETPETAMTPEAMRRLADLQIEKQFGIRAGDGKPREMAAPERAPEVAAAPADAATIGSSVTAAVDLSESDREFEQRTTAAGQLGETRGGDAVARAQAPGVAEPEGPLEAIALYDRL
ncbi:MAG TPA: hypothetical protein VFP48_05395, partial [Steroidobacteraceae bacterium]|nr:hypothetical protein [Steroidobacteraceae bacterium]